MEPEPTDGLSDDELADLARLADGTLPAERRAEVEARVAASPQLVEHRRAPGRRAGRAARHGRHRRPGAAARATSTGARGAGRTARGARRRFLFGGALAAAAAVALALIARAAGRISGGPSVADAAALAKKPPTQPAPAACPGTPQLLRAEVDDVPFPNYAAKFGWTAVRRARGRSLRPRRDHRLLREGRPRDRLHDRVRRLARPAADARVDHARRRRVPHASATTAERRHVGARRPHVRAVRRGCAAAELLELADWRGKGAIPF